MKRSASPFPDLFLLAFDNRSGDLLTTCYERHIGRSPRFGETACDPREITVISPAVLRAEGGLSIFLFAVDLASHVRVITGPTPCCVTTKIQPYLRAKYTRLASLIAFLFARLWPPFITFFSDFFVPLSTASNLSRYVRQVPHLLHQEICFPGHSKSPLICQMDRNLNTLFLALPSTRCTRFPFWYDLLGYRDNFIPITSAKFLHMPACS